MENIKIFVLKNILTENYNFIKYAKVFGKSGTGRGS